ncbi:c-type cytochrome biogenesis protein CcmI [Asticcacaulis sp. EMRT-3]|uniref:c-type cytochrome biogenesis protein CcmI n=1 Tax=Asticcacaulis sp. EMRT-3 TaxID=3040349 RepID=UPI0024AFB96E|nr:c-type cytochrome biogenesis protein CcmI [Asticcacaulis sp. EMRT-3]MDI7775369.1 c-type cytochrome biogenesis protein CcmI [Asticcacaulis sp. EMRT-3]
MLLLALVCALITAALIALAAVWQKAVRSGPPLAQEQALYEGFVADVERRFAAGDLDAEAASEEKAAAGRALLRAGDAAQPDHQIKPVYGLVALIIMAVVSLGLYGLFGHPLAPDQPFQARLQAWTHTAQTDPNALSPEALALVLRQGRDSHAKDPAYWLFMGRIDMLAGNNYQGAQDYEKARALDPQHFTAWSELGEALTFVANGNVTDDAKAAFGHALAQDPQDARAHFYLGQQAVAQGDYETARTHFTTALATMDAHDSSRPMVQQALDAVAPAEKAADAMKARIGGMVASLEAQLKASPDNPDGWARLIRSYNVLGDTAGQARAVQAMQAHYRDKPAVAADILARSQQAVGAENTGGL